MNRIDVKSSMRSERGFKITAVLIGIGMLLAAVMLACEAEKVMIATAIAADVYLCIYLALWIIATTVTFDKEWLKVKHTVFKTEMRMSEISSARYYISEYTKGRHSGSYTSGYRLILRVDGKHGKILISENINASEIEHCKRRKIRKDVLDLYETIEESNPKAAKGYWRYCGI